MSNQLLIVLIAAPLSIRRWHDAGNSGWWQLGMIITAKCIQFTPLFLGMFLNYLTEGEQVVDERELFTGTVVIDGKF